MKHSPTASRSARSTNGPEKSRLGPATSARRLKPLIEHFASEKKETEVLDIFTSYLEFGNQVPVVQHPFLSCLAGRRTSAGLKAELSDTKACLPAYLPIRCILALACCLENQVTEALALTEDDGIDRFADSPGYRTIRGIAFAVEGRAVDAAILLDHFSSKDLLSSKKRELQEMLKIL